MRLLIISDIHANLTALEAVLQDCEGEWEQIWFLGDLVGYGPDPDECAARLRQLDHLSLSGNHDWAVLGRLDINAFNNDARYAIEWTQKAISAETRAFLESLPPNQPQPVFTLAHGSPRHPVWEYILDEDIARENFSHFETPFCLVGHTHIPVIYEQLPSNQVVAYIPGNNQPLQLDPNMRLIINPGSVGQPRDSDPRAAYALLNTTTLVWEFRRVAYDVAATQARMRQQDMPPRLINRLQFGW